MIKTAHIVSESKSLWPKFPIFFGGFFSSNCNLIMLMNSFILYSRMMVIFNANLPLSLGSRSFAQVPKKLGGRDGNPGA